MTEQVSETRRGVSNRDERGSAENRRKRKAWLMERWAADKALIEVTFSDGLVVVESFVLDVEQLLTYDSVVSAHEVPTVRCYRCGALMALDDVTIDRILCGDEGGRYSDKRNIRPACGPCNEITGGSRATKPKVSPKYVSCPRCQAPRGSYCRRLDGLGSTDYHQARRSKASKT